MLDLSCRALTFQILVLEFDLLRKITSPSIHCQSTVILLLPGLINKYLEPNEGLARAQSAGFFLYFFLFFLFLFLPF